MILGFIILFFLYASLTFYFLLGGADFGAGILEAFTKKQTSEHKHLIKNVLGPIWEANHIWIILALVIFFVAFPIPFTVMTTYLHIPILLILVGIVLRGCAFVFRYYDTKHDYAHVWYSRVFIFSSFMTPFFWGVTGASLIYGQVNLNPDHFIEGFIAPWLNPFCLVVGVFMCCVVTYLAALYLLGETTKKDLLGIYTKCLIWSGFIMMALGFILFLMASNDGIHLIYPYLQHPLWQIGIWVTTLLHLLVLWGVFKGHYYWARVFGGLEIGLVILLFMLTGYPHLIFLKGEAPLHIWHYLAPDSTQFWLVVALVGGSSIIFPSLYFLFRLFQSGGKD